MEANINRAEDIRRLVDIRADDEAGLFIQLTPESLDSLDPLEIYPEEFVFSNGDPDICNPQLIIRKERRKYKIYVEIYPDDDVKEIATTIMDKQHAIDFTSKFINLNWIWQ